MMEKTKRNRIGKQFKTLRFDTKDVKYNDGSRTISGYAAVFGNIDKAGDLLVKGCFAKSISDRGPESQANDKIIMLWMHDMNEPIGRIATLLEDDKGLYFEAVIDDVPRGNQAIEQLKSGTLNQFSIGFRYVWDRCEYDNDLDAFVVKEAVLYEISVVSIGCNGETEFLGFKSGVEDDLFDGFRKEADLLCKHLPAKDAERVQYLIRKAMSLPVKEPDGPLRKQEADGKVKYFGNLKMK